MACLCPLKHFYKVLSTGVSHVDTHMLTCTGTYTYALTCARNVPRRSHACARLGATSKPAAHLQHGGLKAVAAHHGLHLGYRCAAVPRVQRQLEAHEGRRHLAGRQGLQGSRGLQEGGCALASAAAHARSRQSKTQLVYSTCAKTPHSTPQAGGMNIRRPTAQPRRLCGHPTLPDGHRHVPTCRGW